MKTIWRIQFHSNPAPVFRGHGSTQVFATEAREWKDWEAAEVVEDGVPYIVLVTGRSFEDPKTKRRYKHVYRVPASMCTVEYRVDAHSHGSKDVSQAPRGEAPRAENGASGQRGPVAGPF